MSSRQLTTRPRKAWKYWLRVVQSRRNLTGVSVALLCRCPPIHRSKRYTIAIYYWKHKHKKQYVMFQILFDRLYSGDNMIFTAKNEKQAIYSLKIRRLTGTGIPIVNLRRFDHVYNGNPYTHTTVSSWWIAAQKRSSQTVLPTSISSTRYSVWSSNFQFQIRRWRHKYLLMKYNKPQKLSTLQLISN